MRQAKEYWLTAVDTKQPKGKLGQELDQKDPVSISEWLRQFQAEEARQQVILEQMLEILGIPEKAEPKQSLQIPPWEVPSSVGRAG